MSELLTQYFERYAENAITKMKAALIAVDYYERIRLRLVQKEDLSKEIAIIAKVGPAGTMTVVKEAITDYKAQVAGAWELNQRLQDIGKHKISLVVNEREQIPRADVAYQFKSKAGTVKVHITTAGENYTLSINAGKNPMAAQMACIELEKQLTFIALTA
ncbi:MAG: hypothetical protein EBX12_07510 [Actinobacteria bacterium]|nr:hypothetical protein [Actinomycetota bacterium]